MNGITVELGQGIAGDMERRSQCTEVDTGADCL